MSIKHRATTIINSILKTVDAEIVRKSELNKLEKKHLHPLPSFDKSLLPKGAEGYLHSDNPRLKELKHKYLSLCHPAADHSRWKDEYINRTINLQFFRCDNAYVFRDWNTEINYILATYYVKKIDKLGLLSTSKEDGLFGAPCFSFNDELTVSRDLLDSIIEIYFLEQTLGISGLSNINILDIGAGYGRLAYRIVESLPNVGKVFCVDTVAESTFISEYYLRFRGVDQKAVVVPLFEIENILMNNSIDMAVNIHCFSECTLTSVGWWLDILKKYKVKYLMIAPNAADHGGTKLLTQEKDGNRIDFFPIIDSKGYKLIAMQPKYIDLSMQKYGASPTYHHLFELAFN